MDPLPTTPTACATTMHLNYPDSLESSPRSDPYDDPALAPIPGAKLRLMCSYGGHIIPRPHDKSLCYVGGETKLVVVDRHSCLSSLSSRLSRSLLNGRPFTLKYQLPNEDLDSLVSISTDEDLENMIEEYDRLTSTRIRLFVFFNKPETAASMGSLLDDAKSETWFVDALNGSGLLPRGLSDTTVDCFLNLDNDNDNTNDLLPQPPDHHHKIKNVHDFMPDSSNSSFGSSSSSPSMSNLPPIRVRLAVDDHKNGIEAQTKDQYDRLLVLSGAPSPSPSPSLVENTTTKDDDRSDHGVPIRFRKPPLPLQHKVSAGYNLPISPDSVASDSSAQMYYQQDQVLAPPTDNRSPTSPNTKSDITAPSPQIQDSPGYILSSQLDQQQQFVHYIPHQATPISSYYQMYAAPQHQMYLMPTAQTQQPYMSIQSNMPDNSVVASSRSITPPIVAGTPPIYPTKTATQAKPEMPAASVYRTTMTSNPQLVQIPTNQFQQQYVGYSQMQQCIAVANPAAAAATPNYGYEYANPEQQQMYYAQHQGAPLPPQYQTMTPAAAVAALVDASKQLPTDNTQQQIIRTS